jgi:hypothetical protein
MYKHSSRVEYSTQYSTYVDLLFLRHGRQKQQHWKKSKRMHETPTYYSSTRVVASYLLSSRDTYYSSCKTRRVATL